jgi:hypothetical protein
MGMLALHPGIQEEVVEQIISVIGYDRDPVRDCFTSFYLLIVNQKPGI